MYELLAARITNRNSIYLLMLDALVVVVVVIGGCFVFVYIKQV